jgi:hypothetical protein
MESPGAAPSAGSGPMPFTRLCSAHAARRSNSPSSFPPPRRAPPSAPSSPRKRRRPRKGYAGRVDRRHGSLASSHGRRKNPVALVPDEGGLRPRTRQAELARDGNIRSGRTRWRAPRYRADGANHLGDTGCASSEWVRPATVVLAGSRQEILRTRATVGEGERGPRREPRAEEDSRLAGVPARRTCVAEIGSAVAAQRSPFETPTTGFRSARRSPVPAACESRVGQQAGRRGLRSRVNLSDGIARCPPERAR